MEVPEVIEEWIQKQRLLLLILLFMQNAEGKKKYSKTTFVTVNP